jgi:hypothetical protein
MSLLPGSSTLNLIGGSNPTGTTLIGGVSPYSACGSQLYFGTLTRQ